MTEHTTPDTIDLKARLQLHADISPDATGESAELASEAADALDAKDRTIAGLREALDFIADTPEPGAEKERSATFYRVHAAMLKQIAAKALGRETVSQEAFDTVELWWNSEEGIAAREALKGQTP